MYTILEDDEARETALTYFENMEDSFLDEFGQPYKSFEELCEKSDWDEDRFFKVYSGRERMETYNPKLLDNQKKIVYNAYLEVAEENFKNEILYQDEHILILTAKNEDYIKKVTKELGSKELGYRYNYSINVSFPASIVGKIDNDYIYFKTLDSGIEDFLEEKKRIENMQKAFEKVLGKSLEVEE